MQIENNDRERLAVLETDVKHIRRDTGDIKESIQAFLSQISNQSRQIENLRVRMRNSEEKIRGVEGSVRAQNTRLWRISIVVCLIASGVGVGADKIFGAIGM